MKYIIVIPARYKSKELLVPVGVCLPVVLAATGRCRQQHPDAERKILHQRVPDRLLKRSESVWHPAKLQHRWLPALLSAGPASLKADKVLGCCAACSTSGKQRSNALPRWHHRRRPARCYRRSVSGRKGRLPC